LARLDIEDTSVTKDAMGTQSDVKGLAVPDFIVREASACNSVIIDEAALLPFATNSICVPTRFFLKASKVN
jgi:hypothetical protein